MKWSHAFLAAVFLVSSSLLRAQATAGATWLELEQRWNNAHLNADVQTLAELWSDDLVVIVPKMPPFDKASSLTMWRTVLVKFTRYESSEIRVQEFGDTAVVTGRIARSRDFGGRAATDHWLFTKVYGKRGGRWQVINFHASEAP